jgi:Uma2 family endonuclease
MSGTQMKPPVSRALPPLEAGDHLDQKTFHARYEAMPEQVRAELVEGIVHMPSPIKPKHGLPHGMLLYWLVDFQKATPGTQVLDNTSAILGPYSEPQPDACLLVLPEYGGRTHLDPDENLVGAPEFVAEIASSSESYDLHEKRRDYERAGVQEYLVVAVREAQVYWWTRGPQGFVNLPPDPSGIIRSTFFGGLWLDTAALLRGDAARLHEVLAQGLASADHAQLLQRLKRV